MGRLGLLRTCRRELASGFDSTQRGGDELSRHRARSLLLLLLRLLAAS